MKTRQTTSLRGLRTFCVAPVALRRFIEAFRAVDAQSAQTATRDAMASACPEETRSLVSGYKHGYAPS